MDLTRPTEFQPPPLPFTHVLDLNVDYAGRDNVADMAEIVKTYNLTPRKCLSYRTPLQALFSELGRDVRMRFA